MKDLNTKTWIIVLLVLLGVSALCYFVHDNGICSERIRVQKVSIVIDDDDDVEQVEQLENSFNNVKFIQGTAELSNEAKGVLQQLAIILKKNSSWSLKVVGHTSAEGNKWFNLKLSKDRAKAVVNCLESLGVSSSQLQYEGKGTLELLDPNNPEVNRRTEFIILK